MALDIYIQRVDKCSFGDTFIKLFKGPNSKDYQELRAKLLVYLKGSKKAKTSLQTATFAWFQEVWDIRCNHLVPHLPKHYILYLLCCFKKECTHPLCKSGSTFTHILLWYTGRPYIYHLAIPD